VAKIKHTRNENGQNFTHQNKTTLFWRKKAKINLHQNFPIYGITGCDTTSSFFGIGKKSMLKALKETPDQFSDLSMISHADVDDSVDVCRKVISRLYDQKGKSNRCHSDLNRFCVKLATCKDSSLIRLPPCEATFKQHVLRTSLQKIWMNAHEAMAVIGSSLQYGWKEFGLEPVLFEGQMSSDFLQDLVCTCKGKSEFVLY
jgi:hypothetical protein